MTEQSTTSFYVAGGTLRPDTPSYVERRADQELFDRAMAGDFCYVLTSRQMGKSSLMARAARRLKEAGVNTARTPFNIGHRIDLTDFTFEDAKPLARGLGAAEERGEQTLRRILQRMVVLSAVAMLLIGFGVWYTLFLPSEYIRQLQSAMDDYPGVAYAKLHRLPGFGGKADELMAQFWERHALREEGVGNRDEAMLLRLQAVSTKSTDLRRSEANLLIGSDYNNLLMTYRHIAPVNAIAFSPDGKFVLTGSSDGTARLWRVDSGQLLPILRSVSGQLISPLRHGSDVKAVAFSPDGKYAMAMTDNWIHLSSVTGGVLIHRASRRVPGPWRAGGFHFDSSDGSRLRIAWLPTGDSIKIDTLRFDAPDAPPIEGDPKELLNDWMKRLALKFDERWKIVPSQSVEAAPTREGKGQGQAQ